MTAAERLRRQRALTCALPNKDEAMAGCSQTLDFAVFFDGTGNNREQELAKPLGRRALSNIAKLFDAHQAQQTARLVTRYIPGVGTPFPTVGDPGGNLGMGIGKGADKRIAYALDELDKAIARFPKGVKLTLVTVTVFGFSRGAAAARAFARDLAARCRPVDGGHHYRGIGLRIGFLGIFDTVCSAWDSVAAAARSANGGHNGWAHDMRLPAIVEQCVHMTAGHEARRRFPLDSTRIGTAYPANTHEVCYPGVHADIGGGYAPNEQGRRNTVSRFALNEMHQRARANGVRLLGLNSLPRAVREEFELADPELLASFNAYTQALGKVTGTLEELQAAHMELLHRWLKQRTADPAGTESAKRLSARRAQAQQDLTETQRETQAFNQRYGPAGLGASQEERTRHQAALQKMRDSYADLAQVSDEETDLRQEDTKVLADIEALRRRRDSGAKLTLRERTLLRAWDNEQPLAADVGRFFDLFTHDSIAHFDYDSSRLTDWRTIYFGDAKYSPS